MFRTRMGLLVVLGGGILTSQVAAQPPGGRRPELERRFEERISTVLQQRLDLKGDQVVRLREFRARAEPRRRALMMEDRKVRNELREALADSTAVQERVATLLDRSLKVQRDRVQLMDEENRELANFLSPVQRARYFGLLEQLARRTQEMRDQRDRRGYPGGDTGSRRRPSVRRPPGESTQGA